MEKFGATFLPKNKFKLPITLISSAAPIGFKFHNGISSQIKSAVILGAINSFGKTQIIEKIKSRDHTEKILKHNSKTISVKKGKNNLIEINGRESLKPFKLSVPGDPSSASFYAALCLLNKNSNIKELPEKSIIGTSSFRREFQIKNIRPDIDCKLIRGNVDTRIKKLKDGLYDAVILSYAGINSLKMSDQVSEVFSVEDLIPSAGQGIISLQTREKESEIKRLLTKINHQETCQRAIAERNVLKVLEGDCETAVGVHAVVKGNNIVVEAELFSLDGTKRFYEKKSSEIQNAQELGEQIGKILKTKSNNAYKK